MDGYPKTSNKKSYESSASFSKVRNYTGGSFGGMSTFIPGYRKNGQKAFDIENTRYPSVFVEPKILNKTEPKSETINEYNLMPVPSVRPGYGSQYDNIVCNNLSGHKHGVDCSNKLSGYCKPRALLNNNVPSLTGFSGYSGYGYWYDPWYQGIGIKYPIDSESEMYINGYEKDMNNIYNYDDNMVNTIQDKMENFETGYICSKTYVMIFFIVLLIVYILMIKIE